MEKKFFLRASKTIDSDLSERELRIHKMVDGYINEHLEEASNPEERNMIRFLTTIIRNTEKQDQNQIAFFIIAGIYTYKITTKEQAGFKISYKLLFFILNVSNFIPVLQFIISASLQHYFGLY